MTVNYYAIYDKVAKEYGDLMFAKNDDVMLRLFKSVNIKHPEINLDELDVYKIGTFDNETGSFVSNLPTSIINNSTVDIDSLRLKEEINE